MKIPDYSPLNLDTVQETGSLTPHKGDGKSIPGSESDIQTLDSAELSSVTKILSIARESDTTRVEELRRQVASGTYTVDSAALAKKLIDSMSEES